MKNSPDPSIHQSREREMIEHVERLLSDSRFMVDTLAGRKPVPNLKPQVARSDHGTDVKRQMSELNRPDRTLQERMPLGQSLEISLYSTKWLILKKLVGKIHVACVSPTRALISGEAPKPLDLAQTRKALTDIPAATVPTTVVLVSTSGFELPAHELAQRTADHTVILAEPNDAGGWTCHGPVETKALVDLFDPEAEQAKRNRVRELIEADKAELAQGGIASDKLAAKTQLPIGFIESEVKSYAKANPGLAAKRLDGRLVLYREGTAPPVVKGGSTMPLVDKIKSIFSRKGETEKKIAFLSQQRAALTQQRDRAYEEIASLEAKDQQLTTQFKENDSTLMRKRITGQLIQLRKDMERRQQMLGVFNQQINVIGTHLHNLELTQQGTVAKLPDSEEIATDAAAAEEMLAKLQADTELADSVATAAPTGLSEEEQELYEQLEREAAGPTSEQTDPSPIASMNKEPAKPAAEQTKRRAEPEAG
ncbi:MAG TPA: hypothetical protein VHD56_12355 [Tepidisphaeraceae bacterium]|nr:hypothetical protein [Tepidisphaeraceae bacterium]